MTRITVTDRGGAEHPVDGSAEHSLMEAIRSAGLDELAADCGGCCSCATCHVYVSLPPGAEALPPVSEDEDDLLGMSEHRRASSRLSCQVPLASAPQGLKADIAPEG